MPQKTNSRENSQPAHWPKRLLILKFVVFPSPLHRGTSGDLTHLPTSYMAKPFREFGTLCKDAWTIARSHYLKTLLFLAATALFAVLAIPHSPIWLHELQLPSDEHPTVQRIALGLSELGELQNATLGLSILFWVGAAWRKRPDWRRAGTACAMSGITAGILVNILRPVFGRPRPCAGLADGFHFFTFDWNYNAFPSGHSMSNFASATALVVLKPVIGIPYFAVCFGIAWSRMQLDRHDPVDVTVGALLGIGIGLLFGYAARKLNLGDRPSAPKAVDSPSGNGQSSGPLEWLGRGSQQSIPERQR